MSNAYVVEAVHTADGRRNEKLAGWRPSDSVANVFMIGPPPLILLLCDVSPGNFSSSLY
jgi:hypothetical protein